MCLGWAIRVRALLLMQAALLVMQALERGTFLPQNVSHRGAISRHSGDMRPGGWAEVRPVWGSAAFRAH